MNCVGRGGICLVNARCDVEEEDRWRRESYEADWLDLVMETRPEYKQTVSEKDVSRRETYEQQQQVIHFLIQSGPDQKLRLGKEGEAMTEYQLPTKALFPVSVFKPIRAASPWDSPRASSPSSTSEVWGSIMDLENNGVCMDKHDVSVITKHLPSPTLPIRVNFRASSLMSSPRESSNRRRE